MERRKQRSQGGLRREPFTKAKGLVKMLSVFSENWRFHKLPVLVTMLQADRAQVT
jgi:hypothetical protein